MSTSSPIASSSRFEELPPSPTSSTHSFHSTREEDSADRFATTSSSSSSPVGDPVASTSTSTTVVHEDEQSKPNGDKEEEDDDLHEDSVWWTPSELRDILDRSTSLKVRGNTDFGRGQWEAALTSYQDALVELPVRTKPGVKIVKDDATTIEGEEISGEAEKILQDLEDIKLDTSEGQERTGKEATEHDEEEHELSELRSVLFANVAACCLKLERWKEAVEACDEALKEKPKYVKALHRRALANEQLGTWSSLTSSLEDFNTLSKLPDVSPSLGQQIKVAQARLAPKVKAQQSKEQEEMMGKLKDLGNTVLGKFGLSTDNFKFVEQPGGGYSMNFER